MNADKITNIEQVKAFLAGTTSVLFEVASDKQACYLWISKTLVQLDYHRLGKANKGVVLEYLQRLSGYSRQQLSRLVKSHAETGKLSYFPARRNGFKSIYTLADILLLAEVDVAHEHPSGAVVKKICERMHKVHGEERFRRLSEASVAQIYLMRKTQQYRSRHTYYQKTQPVKIAIGASLSRKVSRATFALTPCIRVIWKRRKAFTISTP